MMEDFAVARWLDENRTSNAVSVNTHRPQVSTFEQLDPVAAALRLYMDN